MMLYNTNYIIGINPRGRGGGVVVGMLLETTVNKRDFPGGPLAKNLHSQCRGPRFHLWSWN